MRKQDVNNFQAKSSNYTPQKRRICRLEHILLTYSKPSIVNRRRENYQLLINPMSSAGQQLHR